MQKGVRSKTFFFLKEVLDKMTVKKMLKWDGKSPLQMIGNLHTNNSSQPHVLIW